MDTTSVLTHKVCTFCKLDLAIHNYGTSYKPGRGRSYFSCCKKCRSERLKILKQRKMKEKLRQMSLEQRDVRHAYRERNKEKLSEANKQWVKNNPERVKERSKRQRQRKDVRDLDKYIMEDIDFIME